MRGLGAWVRFPCVAAAIAGCLVRLVLLGRPISRRLRLLARRMGEAALRVPPERLLRPRIPGLALQRKATASCVEASSSTQGKGMSKGSSKGAQSRANSPRALWADSTLNVSQLRQADSFQTLSLDDFH